jgi:hypothetical protein
MGYFVEDVPVSLRLPSTEPVPDGNNWWSALRAVEAAGQVLVEE